MFDTLIQKVAVGIISLAMAIAGLFGIATKKDLNTAPTTSSQERPLGATIPTVVSLFETSLQSGISDTASSMTLISGSDRGGNALAGYMCFTIDEGTSVAEFVCGSASSTAITSLTRGISPLTGTSSVTSLKYVHRRGASVKITNYPQLAIVSRILNGSETLPNQLVYETTVSSSTMASNLQNVASVAYVNSVAIAGAPNASTIAKGLVETATTAEVLAGTATGATGALLYAPNSLFNQTPSATNIVPVTNTSGKLAQGFLDLTQSFAWSGAHTFTGAATFSSATTTLSATTTIAASASNRLILNTVPYTLPSSQGAANTALINNGSGVLSWAVPTNTYTNGTTTKNAADASATQTIAHSCGVVPKKVRIRAYIVNDVGATRSLFADTVYNGTTQSSVSIYTASGPTFVLGTGFSLNAANATADQTGVVTVDSTNINIVWTKTNSPTGTYTLLWEANCY